MKRDLDKNFNTFISFLLGGGGTGLIFIPQHFGVESGLYSTGIPTLTGFACFTFAILLQVSCVWRFSKKQEFLIQGIAGLLLFFLCALYAVGGQGVGSAAMGIGGAAQFAYIALFHLGRLEAFDLSRPVISLFTFSAGLILAPSAFESVHAGAPSQLAALSAGFLLTAFAAGTVVVFPGLRFETLWARLQILPWAMLSALIAAGVVNENLVLPGSVIFSILFLRQIPWERLEIPFDDILSRRVVAIGFAAQLAHLIFMSALLHLVDPAVSAAAPLTAREAALAFFLIFSALIYYLATTVVMTTSGLIQELNRNSGTAADSLQLGGRIARYIKPFIMTPEGVRGRIQADQINTLARQAAMEKKRSSQLTLLLELSRQLENQLDQPVAAQLAVNTLERALNCALATVFIHETESGEFALIASAGRHTINVPAGYRQDASQGVIGRALRQRKTQVVNDARQDSEVISFKDETDLSGLAVPLVMNGHVAGAITVNNEKPNAFGSVEIGMAEMVAEELIRAWERSGHHQRLMALIQTGSQLTSALDPETTAQEVAWSSREILQAKFTFIYIQLGQERNFIQKASSGSAPILFEAMNEAFSSGKLTDLAGRAAQPFRIRDVRKYQKTAGLKLDHASLRSLMVVPIRWHQVNIGAIFAFGKRNETFFTENDESLAELISVQASGAFESVWLQQELRANLRITSLLYRLSNQIILAENIEDAASDIVQTAHKLGKSLATGIVLFDAHGVVLAEVGMDEHGRHVSMDHPMSLIRDSMDSGQTIYISQQPSTLRVCLPIKTPIRSYGAIWMDSADDPGAKAPANPNDLQALVNQAAVALERSLLLAESRRQAKEIKEAYQALEATYDQTLTSLSSALDARDRDTEGHSSRVTRLAVKLGERLGYSQDRLKALERGALLHDIGKIGVSDTILHKPGSLTEDEWIVMKRHPDIGAKIVDGIPFLEDTIPVIRFHQERWDGSGYPAGLKGAEIPELARLFAVIDAFDALTSNRPYRQKISTEEALAYLREQAGVLFDPAMTAQFENLLLDNPGLLQD